MTSHKKLSRRRSYFRKNHVINNIPKQYFHDTINGGGNCFNPAYTSNGSGFPNASMYIPYNEMNTQIIPLPARGGGYVKSRKNKIHRKSHRRFSHKRSQRYARKSKSGGGIFDFANNVQYNYDSVSNVLQGSNIQSTVSPYPFSQPNLLN
jgi:hypothetical protein